MMQDMTHRHEYDNLERDIPMYDGRNIDLADWLLEIEKVALYNCYVQSHACQSDLHILGSMGSPTEDQGPDAFNYLYLS